MKNTLDKIIEEVACCKDGLDEYCRFHGMEQTEEGDHPRSKQVGGSHYKDMIIQPAAYNQLNNLGFLEGNVVKYVSRHEFKNGEEDLDKAIHTLQLLKSIRYDHSANSPTL